MSLCDKVVDVPFYNLCAYLSQIYTRRIYPFIASNYLSCQMELPIYGEASYLYDALLQSTHQELAVVLVDMARRAGFCPLPGWRRLEHEA